jgi:hypothetical protein
MFAFAGASAFIEITLSMYFGNASLAARPEKVAQVTGA